MKPLRLNKPHLIVMVGIPGSGKSFFAEHFSDTFKAPIVSTSRVRGELFNAPSYSSNEQTIIDRVNGYILEELLKTDQTIIFDGSSDTRTDRQDLIKRAKKSGYGTLFIWVQTESSAAKTRATKSTKERKSISADQFDSMTRRFTVPNAAEKVLVISGKHTYASQLKIVLNRLTSERIDAATITQNAPRVIEGRQITVR